MRKKEVFSGRVGHIAMDEKSSVVLRSELDWEFARVLTTKEE